MIKLHSQGFTMANVRVEEGILVVGIELLRATIIVLDLYICFDRPLYSTIKFYLYHHQTYVNGIRAAIQSSKGIANAT